MAFWIRRANRVFTRDEGETNTMVSPFRRAGGMIVSRLPIVVPVALGSTDLDGVEIVYILFLAVIRRCL